MSDYGEVDAQTVGELIDICGPENVSTEEKLMIACGRDKITEEHYAGRADVVVWPRSREEVVEIVRLAAARRIPITPRGGGSGLSGGAVPVHGGIVCAFEGMNRILEIDEENLVVVLEPGVVTKELDRALEPYGLFFAGYPMSEEICQIGGNVAENAGGGRAVKYGVTGDYVLGLEVVTAGGELLRLGGRRIKDVTGYDLVHLFVGSEGTLGLITQITLRLLKRPAFRSAAIGFLPDEAVLKDITPALLRQLPSRPSAIELADATCLRLLKSLSKQWAWVPDDSAMLLVEFDGSDEAAVESDRDAAVSLMNRSGLEAVRSSRSPEEFEELWKIRKQIPWALMRTSPHQTMEDVSVPVSAAWPLIQATRELTSRRGVEIANFGHLGDGNIHCTPIMPPDLVPEEWYRELKTLLPELYRIVFGLGGTISGEHGIGHKRAPYLPVVMGQAEIATLGAVKNALDPQGILNPGKII